MSDRFDAHKKASKAVKTAVAKFGLKQLAEKKEDQANGMTAVYLPEGVTLPQFLPQIASNNVVFAGGLHKDIASKF
jgi:alanine-glyoxylate transaminase / serine-glyoxylate transaminase / serine-pyruvate transaminase